MMLFLFYAVRDFAEANNVNLRWALKVTVPDIQKWLAGSPQKMYLQAPSRISKAGGYDPAWVEYNNVQDGAEAINLRKLIRTWSTKWKGDYTLPLPINMVYAVNSIAHHYKYGFPITWENENQQIEAENRRWTSEAEQKWNSLPKGRRGRHPMEKKGRLAKERHNPELFFSREQCRRIPLYLKLAKHIVDENSRSARKDSRKWPR